mmetsp:Transcript_10015/g.18822  ORF Transcript_10015/g.18822 Transcript_10015/m.18822 type:complete len:201 (-) Transcript_10015:1810-2412(-)
MRLEGYNAPLRAPSVVAVLATTPPPFARKVSTWACCAATGRSLGNALVGVGTFLCVGVLRPDRITFISPLAGEYELVPACILTAPPDPRTTCAAGETICAVFVLPLPSNEVVDTRTSSSAVGAGDSSGNNALALDSFFDCGTSKDVLSTTDSNLEQRVSFWDGVGLRDCNFTQELGRAAVDRAHAESVEIRAPTVNDLGR